MSGQVSTGTQWLSCQTSLNFTYLKWQVWFKIIQMRRCRIWNNTNNNWLNKAVGALLHCFDAFLNLHKMKNACQSERGKIQCCWKLSKRKQWIWYTDSMADCLCNPSSHFSPQFKRKSTEGVSYFLFALIILGNTTYGLSVLLKNPDEGQGESSYLVHHLPWLIGSLGTLSLDLIVSFKDKKLWLLLQPGLWALLTPTYMLHFKQCWACREDTATTGLRSHDYTCGNTICSIKGPNTHREIEL